MDKVDIIADRILLMADILESAPKAGTEILKGLGEEQSDALLRQLELLTDEAERFFAANEPEAPAAPTVEVFENGFVCPDCELKCRVIWDEAGNISGMRCQCGMTHAKRLLDEAEK